MPNNTLSEEDKRMAQKAYPKLKSRFLQQDNSKKSDLETLLSVGNLAKPLHEFHQQHLQYLMKDKSYLSKIEE